MSCNEATALLERLVDGEASLAEKRDAEAHLENCASCRAHLEFLTSVTRAAGSSDLPAPPDSYWEHLPRKVLRRIEEERERSPSSYWQKLLAADARRWVALGATLVVLVAVGVSVLRRDSGIVPEQVTPSPAPSPSAAVPSEPAGASSRQRATTAPEVIETEDRLAPAPPPMARDEAVRRSASSSPESARPERDAAEAETARKAPESRSTAAERPADPAAPAASPPAEGGIVAQSAVALGAAADDEPESLSDRAQSEESAFRLLEQREPAPAASARSHENTALARRARVEDDCERWRRFLSTYGHDAARAADARYELARCSLQKFEREGGELLREVALRDAEAFLERGTDDPRAEEIRVSLARARQRP